MSYTLTDSDLALLANIAGGFNYNRVGVLPSHRFAASVLWANADALNRLVDAASLPPESLVTLDPLPRGVTRDIKFVPGVTYTAQAQDDGVQGFSFSVESGNVLVLGGVGESEGSFANAGSGSGGLPRIPVKAGQWVSMKLAEGMPAQAGRYDIF